jgi:hypothetical protein
MALNSPEVDLGPEVIDCLSDSNSICVQVVKEFNQLSGPINPFGDGDILLVFSHDDMVNHPKVDCLVAPGLSVCT